MRQPRLYKCKLTELNVKNTSIKTYLFFEFDILIISLSGNILTKIISFALKYCRPKNFVHGLWSEASAEALQVQKSSSHLQNDSFWPCDTVPNLLC
jgi:hypothetical protein